MIKRTNIRSIILCILAAPSIHACNQLAMYEVHKSHVDANVPDANNFDSILIADLQSYFRSKIGKSVRIEYELLRREPTQSGVAYPHYYAWIVAYDGQSTTLEGAVRLNAINKSQFEITNFLSKADIAKNSSEAESVFPQALMPGILSRAGK